MFDFKNLEVFIKVAELRSFNRAAEALNTTQPAVTRRIIQLEDSIGHRLLDRARSIRRVELTPKGEELLPLARQLVRMGRDAFHAVAGSALRGRVRLGVAETIIHTWFPALWARVTAAFPDLVLELDVNISPRLQDDLSNKRLDLAFLVAPVTDPNVLSRKLCSFPMAFMVSDQITFPQEPVALDEIVTKPLVTFAHDTKPCKDLKALLGDKHATIHTSGSLEAVVRMALDGHAIAFIPPAVIANKADVRERLRRLNTTVRLDDLAFAVGWPDALVHPAVPKVAEIAIEVANPKPGSGPA
jgi:DNA-binding transcriptional LysR family regulator